MDCRQFSTIVVLDKAKELTAIKGVAFIGSSGSGKTTLVRAIRALNHSSLSIPKRYITRPKREGDDLEENSHIALDTFHQKVEQGWMDLHWKREMEQGRVEHYGFEKSVEGLLPIYSANNDLVRSIPSLNNIIIVGVFAPDVVRQKRLLKRSPDLSKNEISYRLGDSSYLVIPYCHVVIENYGEQEQQAILDCTLWMKSMADKANHGMFS